jgi:hypothetical protein
VGCRIVRILFIAFQAVWLNAVIPGHTRGTITLGGADPCCQPPPAAKVCCKTSSPGAERKPTPDEGRKARCAICFFAARIVPPPVFDLTPAPLELLCVRPVAPPEVAASSDHPLPYHGRAPPAAA